MRRGRKQKRFESRFEPRIRFNWGYHDAANEHRLGCLRMLVLRGPQSMLTVSREYDEAYFTGYAYGRRDVLTGTHKPTSEPAWLEYRRGTEPVPTGWVC